MKSTKREYTSWIVWETESGEWHREDGPAVIRSGGRPEWWLNNKRISFHVVHLDVLGDNIDINNPDYKHDWTLIYTPIR